MARSFPSFVGFGEDAYEQWLRRQVARALALCAEEGLVISWGEQSLQDARAAVIVPKRADFLSNPDVLKELASPEAATAGLTVRKAATSTVRLNIDVLSWIGWFVSRAEEYENFEPDAHGRFPRSACLATRLGLAECPIADLLVMRLRRAVELAAEAAGIPLAKSLPWPNQKRFAVCLTHDVDNAAHRSIIAAARKAAAAALAAARRNIRRARNRLSAAFGLATGGRNNPHWMFDAIARAEAERGFRSAFYLLPHERSVVREGKSRARRYALGKPEIVRTFRRLAKRGWEIGLHTGYEAHDVPEGVIEDWHRLVRILGTKVRPAGTRSHYLRFRVPKTWWDLVEAGAHCDATVGWPEVAGFRSGTCWPYRPFDRKQKRTIPIWEIGMHLMDSGLPSVETMLAATRKLLDQGAETGGCISLLFHTSPPGSMELSATEFMKAYESVLDIIASRNDAWVTTPGALVQRMNSCAGL
ncbi:MAG: polysaccharide deacetylase family protein [Planctomycetota bacterium]|jgi:hypothetical protein